MIRISSRTRLLCATMAVLALAGCSGSSGAKPSPPVSHPPSSTDRATSPALPPPGRLPTINPLTGRGPEPKSPVIAVKIDDTPPGRPQVGVDRADVVYLEEAEAGLTRLVAVFATHQPVVGYVRSTRPSDPDLLLQYGRITEAASGGGHDSLPRLDRSGIRGWINDRGARFYSRVSRQSAYINLVLDLARVAKAVRTPRARPIGWRWSATPPARGSAGTDVRTWVGSQHVEFRWFPRLRKYVRYLDGVAQHAADGALMATSNVVVQRCRIIPHPRDTDVNGNPSQFTFTVGKGAVSVFRNGRRIDGTWSRPRLSVGTRLVTTAGKLLTLMPGNTWVALVRQSVPISGQ